MRKIKVLDKIAMIFLIISGLAWGLWGITAGMGWWTQTCAGGCQMDLWSWLFNLDPSESRAIGMIIVAAILFIIGAAGFYGIYMLSKFRKNIMKRVNAIDWVAMILLIIGGLAWLTYLAPMLGIGTGEERVIGFSVFGDLDYLLNVHIFESFLQILIGIAGLYGIYMLSKFEKD